MRTLAFLSGIPLVVLAIALIALGTQRPSEIVPPVRGMPTMLEEAGQIDDALAWARIRASGGDLADLRLLAALSDLAGDTAQSATTLQRIARSGKASLDEHLAAARFLAAAGAVNDALTILYNAELRFSEALGEDFLSFYVALALDAGRPDIPRTLARRIWKKTGSERALKLMNMIRDRRPAPTGRG